MSTAAQRTRRRQPPEETRRQILDAAMDLLPQRSFRELNVDAVMARTGHSRTLFYRHFDDIPALLLALIADTGAELLEVAEAWSHSESVTPEEARSGLAAFVAFHTRNSPAVRAVVEASYHDDRIEQAYGAMVEQFVVVTTEAIERRINAGEMRSLDAPEVARALVRMLNGYLLDPRRTDDPERALESLWTIWTRTLFPST